MSSAPRSRGTAPRPTRDAQAPAPAPLGVDYTASYDDVEADLARARNLAEREARALAEVIMGSVAWCWRCGASSAKDRTVGGAHILGVQAWEKARSSLWHARLATSRCWISGVGLDFVQVLLSFGCICSDKETTHHVARQRH